MIERLASEQSLDPYPWRRTIAEWEPLLLSVQAVWPSILQDDFVHLAEQIQHPLMHSATSRLILLGFRCMDTILHAFPLFIRCCFAPSQHAHTWCTCFAVSKCHRPSQSLHIPWSDSIKNPPAITRFFRKLIFC